MCSNLFALLDTKRAKCLTNSLDPRLVYQNLCRSSHPYRSLHGTYPPRRDLSWTLPLLDSHIQNSEHIQMWVILPATAIAAMAGDSSHLHADTIPVPQTTH